jgi:hypothetical protein
MLDLYTGLASICCVILWCCISVIRRRLQKTDGLPHSQFSFNQARLLRRYWELAIDHKWSQIPVIVACVVFVCGLTSCVTFAVLLLAHTLK